MSECVVRMEMPQNCCECQLRQEDYDTGEEFCPFTGVECLSIGIQDNCPIICQLPEGHGDLVDAGAFKKNMDYVCDAGGWLEPVTSAVTEYVKKHIDAQTVIVPAEAERSET